ncbi:hypothetical protein HDV57DRAFT_498729 [Trichoderma longibrachiatum]
MWGYMLHWHIQCSHEHIFSCLLSASDWLPSFHHRCISLSSLPFACFSLHGWRCPVKLPAEETIAIAKNLMQSQAEKHKRAYMHLLPLWLASDETCVQNKLHTLEQRDPYRLTPHYAIHYTRQVSSRISKVRAMVTCICQWLNDCFFFYDSRMIYGELWKALLRGVIVIIRVARSQSETLNSWAFCSDIYQGSMLLVIFFLRDESSG